MVVVLLTFRVFFFEDLRGGIGPGELVAYPSERSRANRAMPSYLLRRAKTRAAGGIV